MTNLSGTLVSGRKPTGRSSLTGIADKARTGHTENTPFSWRGFDAITAVKGSGFGVLRQVADAGWRFSTAA